MQTQVVRCNNSLFWLNEETLFHKFKEYCKSIYVIENLLFFKEIQEFKMIGEIVSQLLNSLINENESQKIAITQPTTLGSNYLANKVTNEWTKLHEKAFRIYKLYIEVPSAPLEINVSYDLRLKLLNYLREILSDSNNENSTIASELVLIHEFPNISNMNSVERNGCLDRLIHIFDEALEVVVIIIDTDIFPRFRKSQTFERAKSEHLQVNVNV